MAPNYRIMFYGFITLGIVVTMLTIIISWTYYNSFSSDYGIVINAELSRTKFHLYTWSCDKKNFTNGMVNEVTSCSVEKPLDKFDSEVENNFLTCIHKLSQKLFHESQSETNLYFGATGDLRVLNMTSPNNVSQLLNSIKSILMNNTNYKINEVKLLSGESEALFSWISVNYLLDKVQMNNNDEVITSATLNMGDLSSMFSYETNESYIDNKNFQSVQLFGTNHTVISSSNLCFGSTQAKHRLISLIIGNNSDKSELKNPCMPINSTEEIDTNELKENMCLKGKIKFQHQNYTLFGESDFENCSKLVEQLLNVTTCKQNFDICLEEKSIPPPPESVQYYASNGYSMPLVVLNSSGLALSDEVYLNETKEFCAYTLEEVKNLPKVNHDNINDYCFDLLFNYHTLKDVYKINGNWSNIMFADSIVKNNEDWTLGYMLNATASIPSQVIKTCSHLHWYIFAYGMILALLSFVISTVSYKRIRIENREIYEPIQQQP